MVGLRFGKTLGVKGIGRELLEQTARDVGPALIRGANRMVEATKKKLSVRGGPSRPGAPPALDEGMIHDGIGRADLVVAKSGGIGIAWGFGVGREALARIQAHAARRGTDLGEMFAIANTHEYGKVDYDQVRTHPPRPYVRPTEAELQAEVVADIERSMGVR